MREVGWPSCFQFYSALKICKMVAIHDRRGTNPQQVHEATYSFCTFVKHFIKTKNKMVTASLAPCSISCFNSMNY